jgi:DNA-binding NarL/FixJ family response regulator
VRFLVVDRHRHVLDALADLIVDTPSLRLVAAVSSVAEAVPLARWHRPDVLLIDVDRLSPGDQSMVSEIRTFLPRAQLVGLSIDRDPYMDHPMRTVGFQEVVHKGASVAELLRRYTER